MKFSAIRFYASAVSLLILVEAGAGWSPLLSQERPTPPPPLPQSVLNRLGAGNGSDLELPARVNPVNGGSEALGTKGAGQNSILILDESNLEELPSPDQQDDLDYLMQAPLHEAFAEVVTGDYGPNPLVARKPPVSIEEIPPQFKPAGEQVVWIDGYWWWDEQREDFIWISGVYRDAPVGQRWVAGYWHQESDGFRWVNGFWFSEEAEEMVYLPPPPASLEIGPAMPRPSDAHYYLPGQWNFVQERYLWQPGFYTPLLDDLVWVPSCYVWTPAGHIFRPGYWDRPFVNRGVVFAPVHFRRPIFLQAGFQFQPNYLIDTSFGLLPHLFVRPNCRNYYFGNWYGAQFVGLGFQPWALQNQFRWRANRFDPLFHYYGSPFVFHQSQPVLGWARTQHLHFANNIGFRPPVSFNVNVFNQQINNTNIFINQQTINQLPQQQVFLADRLDRRTQASLASGNNQRPAWLESDNRELERQRRDLQRSIAEQRNQRESQLSRDLRNRGRSGDFSAANPSSELRNNRATAALPRELREPGTADGSRSGSSANRTAELSEQIRQRQAEAATRAQTRIAARSQNPSSELANRPTAGRNPANPAQLSAESLNRNPGERPTATRPGSSRPLAGQPAGDSPSLTQQLRAQQQAAGPTIRGTGPETNPGMERRLERELERRMERGVNPGEPGRRLIQAPAPNQGNPSPTRPAIDPNLIPRQNPGLTERPNQRNSNQPGSNQLRPSQQQQRREQPSLQQQLQAQQRPLQQGQPPQRQLQQRALPPGAPLGGTGLPGDTNPQGRRLIQSPVPNGINSFPMGQAQNPSQSPRQTPGLNDPQNSLRQFQQQRRADQQAAQQQLRAQQRMASDANRQQALQQQLQQQQQRQASDFARRQAAEQQRGFNQQQRMDNRMQQQQQRDLRSQSDAQRRAIANPDRGNRNPGRPTAPGGDGRGRR
jgi:hypothetical protein